jgi:hypothetical protein
MAAGAKPSPADLLADSSLPVTEVLDGRGALGRFVQERRPVPA